MMGHYWVWNWEHIRNFWWSWSFWWSCWRKSECSYTFLQSSSKCLSAHWDISRTRFCSISSSLCRSLNTQKMVKKDSIKILFFSLYFESAALKIVEKSIF